LTKSIELIVAPDGTSRIETKGFTGADCQQASRFLETALGLRQSESLTTESYQTPTLQQVTRQGGAS
jgi:hypothetical protein